MQADLFGIATDNSAPATPADTTVPTDDIADSGDTTTTYFQTGLIVDGVMFDLSFDVTSTGGFLSGTGSDLGVWSNTTAESGAGQVNSLNAGESVLIDNVILTDPSGTLTLEGISAIGFRFATSAADAGTVNGDAWATLPALGTSGVDSDGSNDQIFNLVGGPASSADIAHTGGAWRIDGVQFSVVSTADPALKGDVDLSGVVDFGDIPVSYTHLTLPTICSV